MRPRGASEATSLKVPRPTGCFRNNARVHGSPLRATSAWGVRHGCNMVVYHAPHHFMSAGPRSREFSTFSSEYGAVGPDVPPLTWARAQSACRVPTSRQSSSMTPG